MTHDYALKHGKELDSHYCQHFSYVTYLVHNKIVTIEIKHHKTGETRS